MIFTIGHSTHSIERFLELLDLHNIGAVCDVRSSPYSTYNPQYNKRELTASLQEHNIRYVFLGEELGARSEDTSCFIDGKVQYEMLAKTHLFKTGLERIRKGTGSYKLALMCAEKEPNDCHRSMLVSRELEKEGFDIEHIMDDGSTESHHQSIERLIKKLKLDQSDLFTTEKETRDKAYKIQSDKIAFTL